MDTAYEAIMRALIIHGWMDDHDGSVDSPTGYFGYLTIDNSLLPYVWEEFADVFGTYGPVSDVHLAGTHYVIINSDGIITAMKVTPETAKQAFASQQVEYEAWLDDSPIAY